MLDSVNAVNPKKFHDDKIYSAECKRGLNIDIIVKFNISLDSRHSIGSKSLNRRKGGCEIP